MGRLDQRQWQEDWGVAGPTSGSQRGERGHKKISEEPFSC